MNFERLLYLRTAGRVRRFHTADWVGAPQTDAHHSYDVLMILREIAPPELLTPDLMWAALTHDAAELIFGDMPSTAGWFLPTVKKEQQARENMLLKNLGFPTPAELSEEQAIYLKAADWLDLLYTIIDQYNLGNRLICGVMIRALKQEKRYAALMCSTAARELFAGAMRTIREAIEVQSPLLQSIACWDAWEYAQELELERTATNAAQRAPEEDKLSKLG